MIAVLAWKELREHRAIWLTMVIMTVGLGLGLSICHDIIEKHGGRLWATVNPDAGCTFQFTLPIGKGVSHDR